MALVQTVSGDSGGYNNSFNTSSFSVTAGSLLVICLTDGNLDTISSITDSKSNTWTLAISSTNATIGARMSSLWYVKNAAAGATVVTVTFGVAQFPDTAYIIREYSGMDTTAPLDVTSSADDGSGFVQTHPAGTTASTSQANELVILGGGMAAGSDPVAVVGSGYGNGVQQKGFDMFTYAFLSDKSISSTGTQTGDYTTTGFVQGQGFIATFKVAAAASSTASTLMMMGV